MRLCPLTVIGLLFCCLAAKAQQTDIFQQKKYRQAGVGIVVCQVDDRSSQDKFQYGYQPDLALTTASVVKLLTTATALEMLGPEARFETRLAYDGAIREGVLEGNLWILPGGDPTLGSEYLNDSPESFLTEWCQAVQKEGITRIQGRVLVQDGLFDREAVSPYWMWEDLGNYYAAGVYDVAVFDNTYRLGLRSGAEGTRPEVLYVRPDLPRLQIDNHLSAKNNRKDSAYLYGIPYQWERRLYGSIPAHRDCFEIKGDIPDPAACLSDCFTGTLRQQGIKVLDEIGLSAAGEMKIFYRTLSQPLSRIIRVINEKSHNLYTEYLLRQIALKAGCPKPVTASDGLREMRSFWREKGLDTDDCLLYDACGLSPLTAMSASSLSRLLLYMKEKSPYGDTYAASLPLAGKEGTVAGFAGNLPGELRLKSGSMTGVKSYAGYWRKGDKEYVVVMMANRVRADNSEIQKDMERFLASLP